MNKQKDRRMKKQKQNTQIRWLMPSGIGFVLLFVLWLVFSNGQSESIGTRPISRLSTSDFHSLAFSLTEPETIFFGHHGGLMASRNGGKDWESTSLKNADAMALAIPSSDPQIMYAAGHDVFFKSINGGERWDSVPTNLPGTDIHDFAVDPENADHVFAHVVGFGIFDSEDGGSTWSLLSDAVSSSTFNLTAGKDSQTLYAAVGEAGLLRSSDGEQTWVRVNEVPDNGAIAVVYSPANAKLYVSNDDGQTWTIAGLNGTILAIAVNTLDPDHIVVVNDAGQAFASRDGGTSWSGE